VNHTEVIANIDTISNSQNIGMFGTLGLEGVIQIVVSIIVVIILARTLMIQHNDVSLRQRPWIVGYSTENRPQNELSNNQISCHLINRGSVPAFDVTCKFFCEQTIQEDTNEVFNQTESQIVDVGPNEEYNFHIKVTPNWIDTTTNKGTVYYGLQISYKDLHKKLKLYEYRGHFINNQERSDKIKII